MKALYLKDNQLIASQKKTAIASAQPVFSPGTKELVVKDSTPYLVTGRVELGEPQAVSVAEFDTRASEHRVSRKQRLQWWPEAETLYLYPIRYTPHTQQLTIDVAPGAQGEIELVGLGLKEIATVDSWHIYEVE